MKCSCNLATVSEIINVIRVLSPLSHISLTVLVSAEMLIHLEDEMKYVMITHKFTDRMVSLLSIREAVVAPFQLL